MIAYPALDLRGGRVVQLVGGDPAALRIQLPDPLAVARQWLEHGFSALHVVDLDAALDEGDNAPTIELLLDELDVPVQVGGGIRTSDAVSRWLDAGASRIVLGTRAVLEPDWLSAEAERHPGRILLAADCRGDEVVIKGWREQSGIAVRDLVERAARLPLAGLLITDVAREGRMEGTDTGRYAELARATSLPVLASGGITTVAELRELAAGGVAGAVLGMALYTGALDAGATAREFGT